MQLKSFRSDQSTSATLSTYSVSNVKTSCHSNLYLNTENFYALRGMSHPQARYEALLSVLAYDDPDFEKYYEKHLARRSQSLPMSPRTNRPVSTHRAKPIFTRIQIPLHVLEEEESKLQENFDKLSRSMLKLQDRVGSLFQQQFSKHIRVIHLPRVSRVVQRIYEANQQEMRPTPTRPNSGKDISRHFIFPSPKKKKQINNSFDENIVIVYDGSYSQMHSDNTISKIFDQDRKYPEYEARDGADEDKDDNNEWLLQAIDSMFLDDQTKQRSVVNDEVDGDDIDNLDDDLNDDYDHNYDDEYYDDEENNEEYEDNEEATEKEDQQVRQSEE